MRKPLGAFAILAGILNLAAECTTRHQNPKDIFQSGNMPSQLEETANPKPAKILLNSLDEGPTLEVAVIDNGVDYLHPDLVGQMSATKNNHGEIIGVGLDVMGDDAFPHPTLIDSTIFAFGAKEISKGRIVEPVIDPIELFHSINEKAVDDFLQLLKDESYVAGTYLEKLNNSNLTILGIKALAEYEFNEELHQRRIEIGNIFDQNFENSEKNRLAKISRYVKDQEWLLSPSNGMPFLIDFELLNTPDAVLFKKFVSATYAKLDEVYGIETKLKPLGEFSKSRGGGETIAARKLHKAWYRVYRSPNFDSGLFESAINLCQKYSVSDYAKLKSSKISWDSKKEIIKSYLTAELDFVNKIDTYVNRSTNKFERDERIAALNRLKNAKKYQSLLLELIETPFAKAFSCNSEEMLTYQSENEEFHRQYRSIYHSDKSMPTHGTHVASTIAFQHPGIKIVPVRVLTSSLTLPKRLSQELRLRFLKEWNLWISSPEIFGSLKDFMRKILGNPEANLTDAELTDHFTKLFSKIIVKDTEDSPLDYLFVEELLKGIRYVGKRKTPLANISLGTEFSSIPTRFDPNNTEQNLKDAFEFLKFEFFKYRVGKVMENDASSTLFLVAAGNSGKWVDGKSRSAIPCDLSSPFFKGAQSIRLPNNQIKNLVCVGSLNDKSRISSFSNLVLTKTPFVFTRGEAVLAAVTLGSCDGSNQQFNQKVKALGEFPNISSNDYFLEILKDLGYEIGEGESGYRESSDLEKRLEQYLPLVYKFSKSAECYKNTRNHAYLTGTSMATPATAGFLAKSILNQMESDPKFAKQISTPTDKIQFLLRQTKPYGGSSILRRVPVVKNPVLMSEDDLVK